MKRITRAICLLLLIGIAVGHKLSSNEVALEQILQHMDDSVNPCYNFHKFSRGKFQEIHKQDNVKDFFGLVKQKFNERMQKVFDRLKYRVLKDPSSVEEKVWLFYNTCLTAPRFTHSWKHYIGLVPPGRGLTWPHLTPRGSQWPEENFKWLETLARLRHFGLNNLLIGMKVQPSREDDSKFMVIIGKQKIDTIKEERETKDLLISLGVFRKKAGILARDITALEKEIKELGKLKGLQTTLSIEEFENATRLDLGKYLSTAFGSSFDSSFVVKTSDLAYLSSLQDLLDTFESETVATYLMVSFVRYLRGLDGSEAEGDPGKCAAAVSFNMYTASELLYKDFYFRLGKFQQYNDEVQRLFELISKSILGDLNLTTEEARLPTQKLNTMTVTVGNLPNFENQRSFVNDFYWNLNLKASEPDFAMMHLKVLEHRNRKVLEQLDGPVPKGREFFLLSNDNYASAEPELLVFKNTIVLPIDILQEPFFTPEMHDVFKVSLLGFFLARQILRNFSPYNHNIENVEAHIETISFLKGIPTRESIDHMFDEVSLIPVYKMYFADDSKFSQEQPSFSKFSLKQLFLLNFAQAFSGETMELFLNQAVGLLESFDKTFNCPTSEAGKAPI